jgi:hypothetical protein
MIPGCVLPAWQDFQRASPTSIWPLGKPRYLEYSPSGDQIEQSIAPSIATCFGVCDSCHLNVRETVHGRPLSYCQPAPELLPHPPHGRNPRPRSGRKARYRGARTHTQVSGDDTRPGIGQCRATQYGEALRRTQDGAVCAAARWNGTSTNSSANKAVEHDPA